MTVTLQSPRTLLTDSPTYFAWAGFVALLVIRSRLPRLHIDESSEQKNVSSPPQKQTTTQRKKYEYDHSVIENRNSTSDDCADSDELVRQKNKYDKFNNKVQNQFSGIAMTAKRFAWEPRYDAGPKSGIKSGDADSGDSIGDDDKSSNKPIEPMSDTQPKELRIPSTVPADAKEQLHFLASMTFANGGLRQPSCPCCQ